VSCKKKKKKPLKLKISYESKGEDDLKKFRTKKYAIRKLWGHLLWLRGLKGKSQKTTGEGKKNTAIEKLSKWAEKRSGRMLSGRKIRRGGTPHTKNRP